MPKAAIILSLLLLSFISKAQIAFKTEVPQLPVIAGESFRVQYILTGIETNSDVTAPPFTGFRMISRPEVYHIDGSTPVKNIVYTLVAIKPGKFFIRGATIMVNGRFFKSDDAVIEVISKAEAFERAEKSQNESEYFLRPGEDPYEKIRQNLFIKVMVNKTVCFIGEPVVATFKLYSRLQSKSDIVKNPGFYGFSVQDIVSLDDHLTNTETINGKAFYVHTVRAVQLYPLQAGMFMIDPMEVMNKVEFSKSIVSKKPEQEITEGVYDDKDERNHNNTVTYENNISTEKIAISVKPHPERNKPREFNGATGNFSIDASLERNELAKNEEGTLIVTIRGKGNFTQLSAPVIQWPDGIEGFDAAIKDSLDKTKAPLTGTRIFRYPFVSAGPGAFSIPSISFPFFNPDSGSYKIISTEVIQVGITDKVIETNPDKAVSVVIPSANRKKYWPAASIALLVFIGGLLWYFKKRKQKLSPAPVTPGETKKIVSINELLVPSLLLARADDRDFYSSLYQAVWKFMAQHFNLTGSEMKKNILSAKLAAAKTNPALISEMNIILQQLETGMFTDADPDIDKKELLEKTKDMLKSIQSNLLQQV